MRDLARWVGLFQSAWRPATPRKRGRYRAPRCRDMQRIWRSYPPLLETAGIGGASRVSGGGYGYGLSMLHNGQWQSAGHAGGLPGLARICAGRREHGVGIVALANVTYANVHDACIDALATLLRESASRPRAVACRPALRAAHDDLETLLNAWDDDLADRLFADNFFLDLDRDHWRARCQQLRQTHGALQPDGDAEP